MQDNLNRPARSQMYVRLVSEKELRKNTVSKYYNTVKQLAPENTITAYSVLDENNNPTHAFLVHYIDEDSNDHVYEIPLVRNLTFDELYEIVSVLDNRFTEGDFLFESSTMDDDECCPESEDVYIDDSIYEQIAKKFAQRQHNKWLQERITNGWHYGEKRNDENKTHPLIKPWEQLSDDEKNSSIDYNLLEDFVDLLDEFGYTIVNHNDVE